LAEIGMLKKSLIVPLLLLIAMIAPARAVDVFMEPDVFLSEVFGTQAPEPSFLWLKGDLKAEMQEILGRKPGGLRMRYWQDSERTVWILEEIGKTQPITTGISIKASAIERVQVLIYRESHGWEVRYPFFTDQFRGMVGQRPAAFGARRWHIGSDIVGASLDQTSATRSPSRRRFP